MSTQENCPTVETLSAWHDNNHEASEATGLEQHLDTCDSCANAVESYRRIDHALQQALPSGPEGLSNQLMQACEDRDHGHSDGKFLSLHPSPVFLKTAAAAVILLSAGAWFPCR